MLDGFAVLLIIGEEHADFVYKSETLPSERKVKKSVKFRQKKPVVC